MIRHRVLLIVLLLSPIVTFAEEPEWKSLFNGEDLSGWSVKCVEKDRGHTFWRVDDGTILADSMDVEDHDYVWLMTDREYTDFRLRFKFQAYRESPGNSGVQIRSRYNEDDRGGWLNGPQVDIHPPGPWRTGMMWDETRGNQRWIFPPIPRGTWVDESMSPPNLKFVYSDKGDGWNEMEIVAEGTIIYAILNGKHITHFNGAGIIDDATHRQKQVGMEGHIALQIHTGDKLRIRYKDIEIKELKNQFDPAAFAQKNKVIAKKFKETLKGELKKALQEKGFAGAIDVCKTVSTRMEEEFTAENEDIVSLRRISLKTRNPQRHTPTAVEEQWLRNTERLQTMGVEPKPSVLFENHHKKMVFPIFIDEPVCLMCHGLDEMISDDVKQSLAKHYPNDTARGYKSGDLRGALVIEWK